MKILLVGNYAPDAQESMLRFERLLREGWTARGHIVESVCPSPFFTRPAGDYRYNGLPKYLGYLDKFVRFPRQLHRKVRTWMPDMVHILDHSNAAYVAYSGNRPRLLTCHDIMAIQAAQGEFPQIRVGNFGRYFQHWIRSHIGRAPHVACVSSATARELLRLMPIPDNRISVIPNALNFPYTPLSRAEAWRQIADFKTSSKDQVIAASTGGFVLNVGGGQWYKNRPGLLRIFTQLQKCLRPSLALIIVGPALSTEDRELARSLGVVDAVVTCTAISNRELQALYSAAECLLFPSWHEGFGWPIAEAQACGCPVFTSDRAPMNEVGGKSAVYFDPEYPAQATEIIRSAWTSRRMRGEQGLAEAQRWQPQLMLDAYEALYRRCQQSQGENPNSAAATE